MGLLDQYFDPETMTAVKQLGQPSEEQQAQAKRNAILNMGLSMMANNYGPRHGAFARSVGAGGLSGMEAYQGAIDDAQKQNMGQFQNAMAMQKLQEQLAAQRAQKLALAKESPEVQQMVAAGMPYKDIATERIKGYTLSPGDERYVGGQRVAGLAPKPEIKEGYLVPDGNGGWKIDPVLYDAHLKAKAAGSTRVNVNQAYEPKFQQELAGLDAKSLDAMRGKAEAGQSMLNTVGRMRNLNDKVYANGTADAKLATANVLAGLGVNIGDPAKLAGSQEFDALASKLVLDSLGGSLGAGTSNADVAFIRKTVPQLGHSAEARTQMYDYLERKAKQQVDTYGNARRYAEQNNGLRGWQAPSYEEQPQAKSKFFKIDGNNVAATLGADGKYYVEKNGKKYRVEE